VALRASSDGQVIADAVRLVPHAEVTEAPVPAVLSIARGEAINVEGNAAGSVATFVVSLNEPATAPTTVRYASASGTAIAGQDYVSKAGTLTFLPGAVRQTIVVPLVGDTVAEGDETFSVALSDAAGATIAQAEAFATIVDNDALWQNIRLPEDVDADGTVTPLDALLVINRLNRTGPTTLSTVPSYAITEYLDVSGDGDLAPLDALQVINLLNRRLIISATRQAEVSSATSADSAVGAPAVSDAPTPGGVAPVAASGTLASVTSIRLSAAVPDVALAQSLAVTDGSSSGAAEAAQSPAIAVQGTMQERPTGSGIASSTAQNPVSGQRIAAVNRFSRLAIVQAAAELVVADLDGDDTLNLLAREQVR